MLKTFRKLGSECDTFAMNQPSICWLTLETHCHMFYTDLYLITLTLLVCQLTVTLHCISLFVFRFCFFPKHFQPNHFVMCLLLNIFICRPVYPHRLTTWPAVWISQADTQEVQYQYIDIQKKGMKQVNGW